MAQAKQPGDIIKAENYHDESTGGAGIIPVTKPDGKIDDSFLGTGKLTLQNIVTWVDKNEPVFIANRDTRSLMRANTNSSSGGETIKGAGQTQDKVFNSFSNKKGFKFNGVEFGKLMAHYGTNTNCKIRVSLRKSVDGANLITTIKDASEVGIGNDSPTGGLFIETTEYIIPDNDEYFVVIENASDNPTADYWTIYYFDSIDYGLGNGYIDSAGATQSLSGNNKWLVIPYQKINAGEFGAIGAISQSQLNGRIIGIADEIIEANSIGVVRYLGMIENIGSGLTTGRYLMWSLKREWFTNGSWSGSLGQATSTTDGFINFNNYSY